MPSSNKTTNLQLNKWIGSDKPKKDDFNSDNQKVDMAYESMSQRLYQAETTAANNRQSLQQSVDAVDGRCNTLNSTLNNHISNAVAHLTAAERTAWNAKDKFAMGTYTGTGASSISVNMGFQPRFGLVFAAGNGIAQSNWANQELNLYAGFFSASGCSKSISVTANGITLLHHNVAPSTGVAYRYNDAATTYVWVAWK